MATQFYSNDLNILEQAKRLDPQNNVATIVELMNKTSELTADMVAVQANDIRSHEDNVRTELPTVGVRDINRGSTQSYSRTEKRTSNIILAEANPVIDEENIDPMPDPKKALNNEYKTYVEAMMQFFVENFFYGNPAQGEILGLFNEFNDLALENVVGLGGTGSDLTSVALIEWDELAFKMVYPRNHKTIGVDFTDKGKQLAHDADNNPFWAYMAQIKMKFGRSLVDPRNFQRICNIESDGATNNIIDITNKRHHELVRARNRLTNGGSGAVIYCNRDIKSQFDIFAMDKQGGFATVINKLSGEPVTVFQNMPIRLVEQMISTEDAVS
jgi:hypothetical protein